MNPAALTLALTVLAMNWEGHEDWMADHPAAAEFERAVKGAEPLPPKPCSRVLDRTGNPYEQVPLRCPVRNDPPRR